MPFLINRNPVTESFFNDQLKEVCFNKVLQTFDLDFDRENQLVTISGLSFSPSSYLKSNHPDLYSQHLNEYYSHFLNEAILSINSSGNFFIDKTLFQVTDEVEPIRLM